MLAFISTQHTIAAYARVLACRLASKVEENGSTGRLCSMLSGLVVAGGQNFCFVLQSHTAVPSWVTDSGRD